MDSDSRRLAVLIDGDSINPAYFGRVLAEAAEHGTVEIRRIYGGHEKLDCWKKCISNHGIESVPNDAGYKNAADVMLIIDAANILHRRSEINGFCIVASDNDFAGLARWLREQGVFVIGIGSKDTPPLDFKRECDGLQVRQRTASVGQSGSSRTERTVSLEGGSSGGSSHVYPVGWLGPSVGRRKQASGNQPRHQLP